MSIHPQPFDANVAHQKSPRDGPASYQHKNLGFEDSFRLLQLHRGQGRTIQCSLHRYRLGTLHRPSYRAISYTWSPDAPHASIQIDDKVFKVRQNLRDALRAIRDVESDCWLWIDAVCIDQDSAEERNTHVKLMADIYGHAESVVVWLDDGGVERDVARALKFVHTSHRSANAVYRSLRRYSLENERNWLAVQKLCRLRYWTRKWIIQELFAARSIGFMGASYEYSMHELDGFCRHLEQLRDGSLYHKLSSAKRRVVDDLLTSAAARLTFQRSKATEEGEEGEPRLLYDLIERYASSECQLPCDHVYALYSLVGEHRAHLSIDYAASPVERLVTVLSFVHFYERLPPVKVLDFAELLVKMFRIRPHELERERALLQTLSLQVPVTLLGTMALQPECDASMELRESVTPLAPMRTFPLDTSRHTWTIPSNGDRRVPREDGEMAFFSIAGSNFYGLAGCRLETGDLIWHFPGTRLVFAVRQFDAQRAMIRGRAYLYSTAHNDGTLKPWLERRLDYNSIGEGTVNISGHLAGLLELGTLAVAVNHEGNVSEVDAEKGLLMNHLKIVWRCNWMSILVAVGSVILLAIFLAVLVLQVT